MTNMTQNLEFVSVSVKNIVGKGENAAACNDLVTRPGTNRIHIAQLPLIEMYQTAWLLKLALQQGCFEMLINLTSLCDITSPFKKSRPRDLYTSKPREYNMGKATRPAVVIIPLLQPNVSCNDLVIHPGTNHIHVALHPQREMHQTASL